MIRKLGKILPSLKHNEHAHYEKHAGKEKNVRAHCANNCSGETIVGGVINEFPLRRQLEYYARLPVFRLIHFSLFKGHKQTYSVSRARGNKHSLRSYLQFYERFTTSNLLCCLLACFQPPFNSTSKSHQIKSLYIHRDFQYLVKREF